MKLSSLANTALLLTNKRITEEFTLLIFYADPTSLSDKRSGLLRV